MSTVEGIAVWLSLGPAFCDAAKPWMVKRRVGSHA